MRSKEEYVRGTTVSFNVLTMLMLIYPSVLLVVITPGLAQAQLAEEMQSCSPNWYHCRGILPSQVQNFAFIPDEFCWVPVGPLLQSK